MKKSYRVKAKEIFRVRRRAKQLDAMKEEIRKYEVDEAGRDLVARGIELAMLLEGAKEWYRERDEIIDQLIEMGTQFEHDGVILTLVDNFADRNKTWKSVAANRYSIEITGKVRA